MALAYVNLPRVTALRITGRRLREAKDACVAYKQKAAETYKGLLCFFRCYLFPQITPSCPKIAEGCARPGQVSISSFNCICFTQAVG
jgi:hypothetical protein